MAYTIAIKLKYFDKPGLENIYFNLRSSNDIFGLIIEFQIYSSVPFY